MPDPKAKIIVVEDERIVAWDIQQKLERMGYEVPSVLSEGEVVFQKAKEYKPDLILMDIHLLGQVNGIEAARRVYHELNIPVVYITAYSDDDTINRAKLTEPFGYLLKPFEERELRTTIEISLHKHKIEQKLRESEKWFSTTLSSIGEAVFATDTEDLLKFVNPSGEDLLEQDAKKLLGKPIAEILPEFLLTESEEHKPITLDSKTAIAQKKFKPFVMKLKNGNEKYVMHVRSPILDHRENRLGTAIVVRDVTREKLQDDEWQKLNDRLLRTQKLESLSILAGGVAKDFNDVLKSIMSNTDMAMIELPQTSDSQTYLKKIEETTIRATELTNQMLAYSGHGSFIVQSIELPEIINQMSHLIDSTIPENIRLNYNYGLQSPQVRVDITHIRQIMLNLLNNSVEAIGDEQGQITIASGSRMINEYDEAIEFAQGDLLPGLYAFLEVRDNGCGMDEETEGKIFDPFFTTKLVGRGLGLAAVLGIVRGLEGAIQVASAPGKGSRFRIYFPSHSNPDEMDVITFRNE
ncbi:response regulator [bacterium]|nr:response regulator [bacterium]